MASQANNSNEVHQYLRFINQDSNIFQGQSKTSEYSYTPRLLLSQYFANGSGSIDKLLQEVLDQEEEHVFPAGDIILEQYLGILTVLLTIGQARYLTRFVERDYSDDRLPFFDRPRHFPKSETGSFFDAFFDAQWRFCPVRFVKSPVNLQVEPEQIIPLKSKEKLYENTSSVTYRVELHEEYDTFVDTPSAFEVGLGSSEPISHRYLFKEYNGKALKPAYDKELAAFLYLQKSGNLLGKTMIGFHGSFVHDETYTLILEDPDCGTLDDFMNQNIPPLAGDDITRLWEELLRLHEALHSIHNISAPYTAEVKQHTLLRGWHQSLSPFTIMSKSGSSNADYDLRFRLLDVGVVNDASLSRLYSAPECFATNADEVNYQMADVWSLGCILSEFAVWISLGLSGLKNYRAARQRECREKDFPVFGAFHDGRDLLTSVRAWHDHAIASKLQDDRVTEPVLHQLVEEMLCEDGDARPSARQLKMKVTKLLNRAREQHLADLNRFDSIASNSTGYSSVGLSSQGPLSHRASVRSDTSTDSAFIHNPSITGRLERSGTARSNITQRDSLTSPTIDEGKEVSSGPPYGGSNVVSPASISSTQHLSNPYSDARQVNEEILELDSPNVPVPKPLRFGNRNSIFDAATLNGDDKEMVVSRGPPPINLKRPNFVHTMALNISEPSAQPILQLNNTSYPAEVQKTKLVQAESSPQTKEIDEEWTISLDEPAPPVYEIRPDHDPRGPSTLGSVPSGMQAEAKQEVDLKRSLTTTGGTGMTERKSVDLRRSVSSPSGPKQIDADTSNLTSVQSLKPSVQVYKPYLDLISGLIWLNQKKGSASSATIQDEHYLNVLADRDFMFLIDDSASMRTHREMTSRAVRLLSWLLKKYDKNGMNLYFGQKSDKHHARPGHSSDIQRPLLKVLDDCKGRSNINARLIQILQEYRDRNAAGTGAAPQKSSRASIPSIGSSSKTIIGAKKIIVFVFTDTNWDTGAEDVLKENMAALSATMKLQGAPENAVGIQFVYTEPREDTKLRLRKLKDGDYGERIAVDYEFLEGNVFRLLLGSISDLWDDDTE